MKGKNTKKMIEVDPTPPTRLVEVAWEVCNQVGGIYTVIRTKIPSMVEKWDDNYCLIGPYFSQHADAEFEKIENADDDYARVVRKMRDMGMEAYYGIWLVTGRPKAVLFNPYSVYHKLGEIKYLLWEHHKISTQDGDELLNQTEAFGYMVKVFITELANINPDIRLVAHFHEWMVGTPIPDLRRDNVNVKIVFTTHATMLGRYLAMNDPFFYDHIPYVDWQREASHYNITTAVLIERAAAHGAHVFSTVSAVTSIECKYLLGREPDILLPNGLNIERFTALHEFQNLHIKYKEKIHRFVMSHFFQSYPFDLDNTVYFFTSGRYEYRNKGFDLTLEALARLNWKMQQENMDTTVVMFFITKRPFHSISPSVLQSRALMEEIRETCEAIQTQVGERLFYEAASNNDPRLPDLKDFVDDYWKLRYRRTIQSWKTKQLPSIVTHNLVDDDKDEILNFLRQAHVVNNAHDKVKMVYHPDFISPSNPLFGMEYGQFVRGCNLGIFPSYYEPWGYTPLECIARGVPAVTSDLSGFGDYIKDNMPDHADKGIYLVNRRSNSFDESANQLANFLYSFVKKTRRDRINQRNCVESASEDFDWKNLRVHYDKAYAMALGDNWIDPAAVVE